MDHFLSQIPLNPVRAMISKGKLFSSPDFNAFGWRFVSHLFIKFVILALAGMLPSPAFAGASASSWVVVVNGKSVNSRTIANHYCHARNIPIRNVIVLPDVPDSDQIHIDQFREFILLPVLQQIETRGLTAHIQGIAYSVDFPTAIDLQSEIASIENRSPYLTPVGSINGMTYLFRFVLAKNPAYIGFESNLFAARHPSKLLTPLIGSQDQANELNAFLNDKKYAEAAGLLDTLCESFDKELVYPMQYTAARQWALAGENTKAIKRLEQSIRGGWSFREQLLQDDAFASLREDKDFIRITKRCAEAPFDYTATRGFEARMFYTANSLGSRNPKHGMSYLMSMVLSVTRDLGITQTEAIENLNTSVGADYTYPQGAFIFTKTSDVRTTTREPSFAMAIGRLQSLGMNAKVVERAMPVAGERCSGVTMGASDYSWGRNGAVLLPGAIAENLTSLGGAMTNNAQTKATEFLRYGAAASSGAVTEPYSIQNKFPHPMIHVHYVEGLTLAESFYSSVLCPYQLLMVGDPLCQPYGKPPRFAIEPLTKSVADGQPFRVHLRTESDAKSTEPESLLWMLDGVARSEAPFEPNVQMLFDKALPGAHEVRLVSKGAPPLESRFEQSLWLTTGPEKEHLVLKAPEQWKLSDNTPLTLTVESLADLSDIKILHDFEVVGVIPSGERSIEIAPSHVGYGPVRFLATRTDASGNTIASLPVTVKMQP